MRKCIKRGPNVVMEHGKLEKQEHIKHTYSVCEHGEHVYNDTGLQTRIYIHTYVEISRYK